MGLDMYLERFPRVDGLKPRAINSAESFMEWEEYTPKDINEKKCTFEEWCGERTANALPSKAQIKRIKEMQKTSFSYWDTNKEYPHTSCIEQVGYWRKANAIHNWFVENIQGGEDDCDYHREISKSELEELKELCWQIFNGEESPEMLETQSGFFFGSTNYDGWYFESLKDTIDIIDKVLKETDFNTQMIYYVSSW